MSLLSLLIALMAEKSLSSSVWRFDHYYQKYVNFFDNNNILSKPAYSKFSCALFLLIPVVTIYVILQLVDEGLLHLIISTIVLIVCFGCFTTRKRYKEYLHASFQEENTSAELHHQQLLQDKNLPQMTFGQALIWLNYRYYIAVMLFFVLFGATGVVFYRLLTSVIEQRKGITQNNNNEESKDSLAESSATSELNSGSDESIKQSPELLDKKNEHYNSSLAKPYNYSHFSQILFYLDWLPVRITAFGYMFVGHFSNAFPMWLESVFDTNKPIYKILIDVAQKSEDIMIDKDDCSAEPCLLVRLAKRNVLLVLSVISIFTLLGLIN